MEMNADAAGVNAQQVKLERLQIKLDQQNRDDLEKLLTLEEGRRFFWSFLGKCRVFSSSFTGNSETFFLEGQRNAGLVILDCIPLTMMVEMEKSFQECVDMTKEIINNEMEEKNNG